MSQQAELEALRRGPYSPHPGIRKKQIAEDSKRIVEAASAVFRDTLLRALSDKGER